MRNNILLLLLISFSCISAQADTVSLEFSGDKVAFVTPYETTTSTTVTVAGEAGEIDRAVEVLNIARASGGRIGSIRLRPWINITRAFQTLIQRDEYEQDRNNTRELLLELGEADPDTLIDLTLLAAISGEYHMYNLKNSDTLNFSLYPGADNAWFAITDEPASYDVTVYNEEHFVIHDFTASPEEYEFVFHPDQSQFTLPTFQQVNLSPGATFQYIERIGQLLPPQ